MIFFKQTKQAGPLVRFFSAPAGIVAGAVTALLLLIALIFEVHGAVCSASSIVPVWERIYAEPFSLPGAETFLGTDYQGRSVFFRALAGTIPAFKVGIIAGVISVITGTALGVCAGFYGGKIDDIVVWIYSTFASMPTLLFILSFILFIINSKKEVHKWLM